ncbi:hypothetical protein CCMA1212_002755 [Trichoderma ghanense]|uniref:Uncharacterized protein n=1 Tax=Trichoderma ghanense TaxID=65468 RepID=A0ABY2HC17_9HYPO
MPTLHNTLLSALSLAAKRTQHLPKQITRLAPPTTTTTTTLPRTTAIRRISAPLNNPRFLSRTYPPSRNMASDEDYMAFLNKANQDADEGRASAAQRSQGGAAAQRTFKATDDGAEIPKPIAEALRDAFYVSEADEPFCGVSLRWKGEGGLPDEVEFAKLIHHWDAENAQIDIMDPVDWDSEGRYANIIDAVREATKGNDVRVYRVARDLTRAEYFVISRDDEGGRIVGVKALGVES